MRPATGWSLGGLDARRPVTEALLWDVLFRRALDRGCGQGGSDARERDVAGLGGRAGALVGAVPVGIGPRGAAALGAGLPQGPDPARRAQERRAAGGPGGTRWHGAAAPLHRRLALGDRAARGRPGGGGGRAGRRARGGGGGGRHPPARAGGGPWATGPLEAVLAEEADALVGGPEAVLVIDDTALPKQGRHSVGVARQYCGCLGKRATCQVLVSLTLARGEVPVPVGLRLFLPDEWTADPGRCARAGVPEEHRRPLAKPEIALEEVDRAIAAG